MMKFIFQKNIWLLDFITTMCFATFVAYIVNADSDLGNPNSKTHWNKIAFEVSTYIITFVFGFALQKKVTWLPSWFWLAVVGAYMRILLLEIISSHSDSFYKLFITISINWIFSAVIGLVCIFTMRFFAYFFWLLIKQPES